MLFQKHLSTHKNISKSLKKIISSLQKSNSREDCLNKTYNILTQRYHGERFSTYIKVHHLIIRDINKLWDKQGFMHCTSLNYLMKFLLVESGFFKEDDIMQVWTQIYFFSPHQYLKVKVNEQTYINIDMWAKRYGVKFGDFSHGFH